MEFMLKSVESVIEGRNITFTITTNSHMDIAKLTKIYVIWTEIHHFILRFMSCIYFKMGTFTQSTSICETSQGDTWHQIVKESNPNFHFLNRTFLRRISDSSSPQMTKGPFCHLWKTWSAYRWVYVLWCVWSAACSLLEAAWLLLSWLLLWLLLDNEPLAPSGCQSGRQTGPRPGHRCLTPSGSLLWAARTGTCQWEDTG